MCGMAVLMEPAAAVAGAAPQVAAGAGAGVDIGTVISQSLELSVQPVTSAPSVSLAPAVSPYWPRDVTQMPAAVGDYSTASFLPPAAPSIGGARTGFRQRRSMLIIGVLVVALGVGGGIAYEVLKPTPATPASVVQQYFDDLGKDDTASALTLVADWDQLSSQGPPTLLVPQALSSASARPADVQVGETTTLSGIGGAPDYSVRVSYKVGGADMTTDFAVVRAPSGAKSPYLLQVPFFDLEIGDSGGRSVTINGISVDLSNSSSFAAFPGAYSATAQGNALLASDTETGVVTPGSDSMTDNVTFAAPQLASGAQDAVQAQVKQQLDTCAQSTDPDPSGCPFNLDTVYIDGDVTSVQWSITSYPNVSVDVESTPTADTQATISDPAEDGLAHYVATYTDFTGATQTTSGDVSFGVDGSATASGSDITITYF